MICDDPALTALDAGAADAFSRALESAPDNEIREALVRVFTGLPTGIRYAQRECLLPVVGVIARSPGEIAEGEFGRSDEAIHPFAWAGVCERR